MSIIASVHGNMRMLRRRQSPRRTNLGLLEEQNMKREWYVVNSYVEAWWEE